MNIQIKITQFNSNGTTDSQQLHRAEHTVTTLSLTLVSPSVIIKLMGSVDCRMVYFCLRTPIILSTCILNCESCCEWSNSHGVNCFFLLVHAGRCYNFGTKHTCNLMDIEYSLSANIRSSEDYVGAYNFWLGADQILGHPIFLKSTTYMYFPEV